MTSKFKLGDRVVPAPCVMGTVIAVCGYQLWVAWDQKLETSDPIDPNLIQPAEEIEREVGR